MRVVVTRRNGVTPRPAHSLCPPLPSFLFSFVLLFALFAPARAIAQSPTQNILPALTPLDKNTSVELVAVTLDAQLNEAAGRLRAAGSATYKLHNTDVLKDVEIPIGFPTWAGANLVSDPNRFDDFKVYLDDRPIRLARSNAALKIGNEVRTVEWYSWTLKIASDEKHLVRVDFSQDLGDQEFPRFQFGILTSTGWKGRIGSERLAVRMPAPTTLEQFLAFDPFTPDFDGQTLTWSAVTFEPSANMGVMLVRPSDWQRLLAQRLAVTQNVNDISGHITLGNTYTEFAAVPSIRRDSFLLLALAEYEIAARLDPKNVTARSQLGQIYEARAGAPTGTRNTNYVALALDQWQNLLGTSLEAEAKRHLAEDNFYLGVDARLRQEYETAVKFLTAARTYAPNGMPPTFTPERLSAENKAALIAWARALAERGDLANALGKARDANGGNYVLAAMPPLPTFAVTSVQVTTNSVERLVTLRVIGLPERAPETDEAFNRLAATLTRANVASIDATVNGTERVVTIRLLYSTDAELALKQQKLAQAFGEDEAWSVVRALLVPAALQIEHTRDAATDHTLYREVFDLTARARQNRLDALSRAISDLDKAKPDDDAAQLQRALLKQMYAWLKNASAGNAAKIEFVTPDGARQEWTLTFNDARELSLERTSLRPEVAIILGGVLMAVTVTGVGLWWVFRKRRAEQGEQLDVE